MPQAKTPSARPALVLSETDAERLSALALQNEAAHPVTAGLLLDELERAQVRADRRVPADVIGMNSTVEFVDEGHGQARTVQLVYPDQADITAGRISIMTPVGAGLIGLKEGQSILWPDRGGETRVLRILKVGRIAA
ncbi:MAG: nucleoside diphosphate kinase regulator [Alphaproteobacteria bacterium]|nr:nucleoside diphosphate kinase regulator [Alphaproteobacteria bacterium]MBU1516726.1 nucleoside diphosphate kinase regulator [Alphaproteobacteria bacterium]MBU2095900.1 nucleoside diphosphate kinase regulator [Alphaproteobacteria bacterium]MBU2153604.1 nucleoside diphosphate kinase regulator [Alphaproteobacteria bacterium]MBU2307352.1 nucleoside diphosphate kinase regulator [Alphaproteobacteria bacterium]